MINNKQIDIDFVILWVDGEDASWLAEREKYLTQIHTQDIIDEDANGDCRYRSNSDLLRYWFRGVEKNAPWVRRIFFISCGQIPEWLNTNNPALEIVDHKNFMQEEFLPTFNCRPIHFNLHRIKDLSEHFVLFDDDMFLLNPILPDFFFRDGYPTLQTYLGYINKGNDNWSRVLWNDYGIVNSFFNIDKQLWKFRCKWFNIKKLGFSYAAYNFLCYCINKTLPVYSYGHLPYPHLKSTIKEVWKSFPERCRFTSLNKFRTDDQLNQNLFIAWNQACGKFYPASIDDSSRGVFFSINSDNLQKICQSIEKEQFSTICINDSSDNFDCEYTDMCLIKSFNKKFPVKSSFEK